MVNNTKIDYSFSKEELFRVLKLLENNASTEINMIKAFEVAYGRSLTDKEILGYKPRKLLEVKDKEL
jgi:hypothetical protein